MATHDQLIGLCEEIAALVRLELPLEEALRSRSRDLPRQLGDRIEALADRLESGDSLTAALERDPEFPPVYTAVIESGLESGNLSGTLEQLAQNLRILRDSRKFLVGATLYPMLVFSVLWFMLTGVLLGIGPAFADFYKSFSFNLPYVKDMVFFREHPAEFIGGMAAILVGVWGLYGLWCYRSGRATLLTFQTPRSFFWLRSANRNLAKAAFARIAALLIRAGLPMPRILHLAAQAVGEKDWSAETEENLGRLMTTEKGEIAKFHPRSPISPLVRWMITVPDRAVLLSGLEQYAEMGVFRARSHLERLELWLPVAAMFLLGGAVFTAYFLTIIFPYGYVLYHLAGQTP